MKIGPKNPGLNATIVDGGLTIKRDVVRGVSNVARMIVQTLGEEKPVGLYPMLEGDELGVRYEIGRHLGGLVKEGAEVSAVSAVLPIKDDSDKNIVIGMAQNQRNSPELFVVIPGEVSALEGMVESQIDQLRDEGELELRVNNWVHEEAVRVVLNERMTSGDFSRKDLLECIGSIRGSIARGLSSVRFLSGGSDLGIGFDSKSGNFQVVDSGNPFLFELISELELESEVESCERSIIGGQLYDQLVKRYGNNASDWPAEAVLYPVVLNRILVSMIRIDSFGTCDLSRLFGDEQLNIENLLENGSYLVFFSPENNADAGHDINNK